MISHNQEVCEEGMRKKEKEKEAGETKYLGCR